MADYRKDSQEYPKIKVRILVDRKVSRYIVNSKKSYGFVSEIETDEGIEMTFMTSEISQGFPRWCMMFGDYITILEPQELKDNMKLLLKKITDKIES